MTDDSELFESERLIKAFGRIFRRRKILLAACIAVALVPVVYYNETTRPVFEASTSLVFEEVSNPIPGDPFSKVSNEQYLFNRLEEINSRAFAEDIAPDAGSPPVRRGRGPVPACLAGTRVPNPSPGRHGVEDIPR
jgi:uncharacterized protein involved in exopolysaccharide biosynthesis